MAQIRIAPGEVADVVSPGEHSAAMHGLEQRFDLMIRDWTRGLKVMRIPPAVVIPSGGNFQVTLRGPEGGYVWAVQYISATGVATADVATAAIQLYRTTDGTFSDRNFTAILNTNNMTRFGTKTLFVMPGESLGISGSGVPGTTAAVTFNGAAIEAPAEMIGKLL